MAYQQGSQAGLPEGAIKRLQDMRGTGPKPKLFTSDLTVNEFVLVKQAGFSPLGLVVGSSIYHVGIQLARIFQNQELDYLTQAMYEARELAMSRMEEEADVLGADGVVGVRLAVNMQAWGPGLAEFMAIGTAVKHDQGGSYRTPEGKPFTSDLSGQDFWALLQSGHRPLELVMGTCVYHVAQQGLMKSLSQLGRNIEMDNFTQAIYDARELAMGRMQAEAERQSATGIVGVTVRENNFGWDSHVIEYLSIGTSVVEITSNPALSQAPTITYQVN